MSDEFEAEKERLQKLSDGAKKKGKAKPKGKTLNVEPEKPPPEEKKKTIDDIDEAFDYMISGEAQVELRSKKTGNAFEYRLRKSDDGKVLFASMKVEGQQYPFQYFGFLKKDEDGMIIFIHGRDKAKQLNWDHAGVKAFDWAWKIISQGELHDDLEIRKT
jgi:hypothetical protein